MNRTCYTSYSIKELLPACTQSTSSVVKVVIHGINAFGNGSESSPITISIGKCIILNIRFESILINNNIGTQNTTMLTTANSYSNGKSLWLL